MVMIRVIKEAMTSPNSPMVQFGTTLTQSHARPQNDQQNLCITWSRAWIPISKGWLDGKPSKRSFRSQSFECDRAKHS